MTSLEAMDASLAVEPRRTAWGPAALVFLIALACYFPYPLHTPIAATEGHRAMTAHQMVESGEWLVPKLYGRVYLAKPPLHYWILATSETLFHSTSPWVWRLPGAIEGALLAAILCLFGNRWFGRVGALVSGLSYVAMFTLWGENRGADIDVTNTLTATFACLCLIEAHLGVMRRRRRWIVLAGLSIGASLMVKGPASLTIIFGTYLAIAWVVRRSEGLWWLARPATWLPLLMGCALFGVYIYSASAYCKSHHLVIDYSGVQEGTQDLHPHNINIKRIVEWVLLPLTMFLFAMPISLALLFGFREEVRGKEPVTVRLILALAWSVVLAWGVCFISGMHLPRYAFVTLPLLCPLAGGVASRLPALRADADKWVRTIVVGTAIVFCVAAWVLSGIVWKSASPRAHQILVAVAVLVMLATMITVVRLLRESSWRAAWGMPIIVLLVSVVFAIRGHYDRLHRNSIPQAQLIRSVAGANAHLVTCAMVLDQPDLFYYSGLETRATDGDFLDWRQLPLNTWVVLEKPELKLWKAEIPTRIWKETSFVANGNAGILLWYGETPPAPHE